MPASRTPILVERGTSVAAVLALLFLATCSRPATPEKAAEDAGQAKPAPAVAKDAGAGAPEKAATEKRADPAAATPKAAEGTLAARPNVVIPLVELDTLTKDPAFASLLASMKDSGDERGKRERFEALRDKGAVDVLMKALHAKVPNVRAQAALVLLRMKVRTKALTDELNQMLLSDGDADVRGIVGRVMVFYLDRGTVPALIEALDKDQAEAVRMHAAWALGAIGDQFGDARVVDPLLKALGDSSTDVRLRAVHGLERSKARRAVPFIVPRLADANPVVRERALTALTKLTGKSLGKDAAAWQRAYPLPK